MIDYINKLLGFSGPDITAEQVAQGTIVDVRTRGEYAQGHVAGSINIPLQELDRSVGKYRKMSQPIITCCASGNRSGVVAGKLNSLGMEAINGGGWQGLNRKLRELERKG
ncbi:rhodanese-like domain-containing protein [Lewinella sp. W8]|uniref:rhodanese-like domain-containing protein n=1 Tax=Lewinella sp. W8 TaxID=2528208 RepID=UPI0010674C0B|nr:rhodanese-like domain-containing protein [Lewinella sp. W8]MTB50350.1 rhodanese-like domain-containing protein [Lewinella sp. W8]